VTPPADHPFGTRNRLVLLADNFIELLTVVAYLREGSDV